MVVYKRGVRWMLPSVFVPTRSAEVQKEIIPCCWEKRVLLAMQPFTRGVNGKFRLHRQTSAWLRRTKGSPLFGVKQLRKQCCGNPCSEMQWPDYTVTKLKSRAYFISRKWLRVSGMSTRHTTLKRLTEKANK